MIPMFVLAALAVAAVVAMVLESNAADARLRHERQARLLCLLASRHDPDSDEWRELVEEAREHARKAGFHKEQSK